MKNDISDLEQISYAKTVYGQKEIDAVVKCLSESTQFGNYSRQFERKIADLFSKKHCLYVNSGSSALFIGVEAFSFPSGGEVITPALTFSTSIGCLLKNITPLLSFIPHPFFMGNCMKGKELISCFCNLFFI